MSVAHSESELQALLDDLSKKYRVPGAVLGILEGDEITTVATGVANRDTGVEATTDTLFQIGSITKVWTATLLMELVEEGLVQLDEPVRTYLPKLRFADEEATQAITVRQLLTHTSGVDGDHFVDTGRGDDCIERYVETCAELPQVAPPGTLFSYCNAGFIVLARLIEVVTGKIWDHALKERLIEPLGLTRTVTLPEEAILERAAIGHVFDHENPAGELLRAPAWSFPRSTGPAGAIVTTAGELLRFARLHLDEGKTQDGKIVLSRAGINAMQENQEDMADPFSSSGAVGLSWVIYSGSARQVLGHDGETIGHNASLRIEPERRFAVALLTNALTGKQLCRAALNEIFGEPGVAVASVPKVSEDAEFDAASFAGVYDRRNVKTTVQQRGTGLVATIELSGELAGFLPPIEDEPLLPVDGKTFLISIPGNTDGAPMTFSHLDEEGRPNYMHLLGRAARRIGD